MMVLVQGFRATPALASPLEEGKGNLGDWQFEYAVSQPDEAGDYYVSYEYTRVTPTDVRRAADAMNRTAAELARNGVPFQATLVFAKPLAIEEFTAFARNHDLTPIQSELRGVDPEHGGVVQLGGPPEYAKDDRGRILFGTPKPGGKPIDTDSFYDFVKTRKTLRVVGIITTDVILDAKTYAAVQNDPRVFAIDVMQHVLIQRVHQGHPDIRIEHILVDWTKIYQSLEKTHIAPDLSNM
jgi:hypothetical protein